ncbi:MAG: NAD(P)-binding domain-containing protein, partial [Nitrososphaerota archaeon]
MRKSDIGLIGLATMGANLALNIEDKGFVVSVYNRTADRTKAFIEHRAKGKNISAHFSMEDFVKSLDKPRRIILMVKAGEAVDEFLNQLLVYLESGDVVVDGGNSHFKDTERRMKMLEEHSIHFMGVGISGGEEGALKGPCIMAGGPPEAEEIMRPVFVKIAAKIEDDVCYGYMGSGGAGHFVKMVHNGIEYAIMQAIAEVYDIFTV